MLNHIGWRKTKKAMTLIEVMISLFIHLIVLTIAFNTIKVAYTNYNKLIESMKYYNDFDDALLNLDRLLKTDMITSIDVVDNPIADEIIIKYKINHFKEDIVEKNIKLSNDKIVIITNGYLGNGTNVLMRNVSNFQVYKKENISYLKITNKKGEERIICI
ncbi:MAG: prepilin-type N-terminal cleavage/methylation domain-containing protein [Clostridium sp.]|nr:prepilin-type N-terminal cleavage/methylation domain-containing protein [Clostridium sp.]